MNIVYLDAIEGGRVEKIFVDAGSMVKKGGKILELANTNLLLDIMMREGELFQQTDNLTNMRLALDQSKLLLNQQLSEIENSFSSKNGFICGMRNWKKTASFPGTSMNWPKTSMNTFSSRRT